MAGAVGEGGDCQLRRELAAERQRQAAEESRRGENRGSAASGHRRSAPIVAPVRTQPASAVHAGFHTQRLHSGEAVSLSTKLN